ncbi:hypothetical protein FIU82_01765 [Pseudoalteromonas sp. THAF3]|uniref:hypothetical protein n=1 Tax=unclassified Pseudoalteromonas TaxID=194690 RepID=UPI0012687979|nr:MULTISPECIES: hypothetical protein [unclassified Pseudoalteromonas]MCG7566566.1 hypothetical protein [Pseudoalteromonas sp. CnMc7-15]QFU03744.1 hypothetical protein FIU82_01765 [Pseudoalteromonas sp. THAF3]
MTTKLVETFERRKKYKVSPHVFGKVTSRGWLTGPKKRLLNHLTDQSDVAAGYTILTAEELREPAEDVVNRRQVLSNGSPDCDTYDLIANLRTAISKFGKEGKLMLLSELI